MLSTLAVCRREPRSNPFDGYESSIRVASMPSSRKLFCDTPVAFAEIDAISPEVWITPGANSVRRVKSRPFSGSSLTRRVSIVLLISGVTALTVGNGGETLTATARLATSIPTLRANACPTSILTDPYVTVANPSRSTVTPYSAGCKLCTRYSPRSLGATVLTQPVVRCVTVTVARGKGAPVASVILPSISPYVVCADAVPQKRSSAARNLGDIAPFARADCTRLRAQCL